MSWIEQREERGREEEEEEEQGEEGGRLSLREFRRFSLMREGVGVVWNEGVGVGGIEGGLTLLLLLLLLLILSVVVSATASAPATAPAPASAPAWRLLTLDSSSEASSLGLR